MDEKTEALWKKLDNARHKEYVGKYVKTVWYHGTTLAGWESIKKSGILVNYNLGNELDFGPGFYLTHSQAQACSFTQNSIKYKKESGDVIKNLVLPTDVTLNISGEDDDSNYVPVLLEYEFDARSVMLEDELSTEFFCDFDDDFANFVIKNRSENVSLDSPHGYDMIVGVQSDSKPTILIEQYQKGEIELQDLVDGLKVPNGRRQISIHNQELCKRLVFVRALNLQTEEELKIDDYVS